MSWTSLNNPTTSYNNQEGSSIGSQYDGVNTYDVVELDAIGYQYDEDGWRERADNASAWSNTTNPNTAWSSGSNNSTSWS